MNDRELLATRICDDPLMRDVLYYLAHAWLVSDDSGADGYSFDRPTFDALTALGVLAKVGRGRWATTEAGQRVGQLACEYQDTRKPRQWQPHEPDLPPLPPHTAFLLCKGSEVTARAWSADEMRAYAKAAVTRAAAAMGEGRA